MSGPHERIMPHLGFRRGNIILLELAFIACRSTQQFDAVNYEVTFRNVASLHRTTDKMPRARASRQLDVTDVADELTFPSLDLSVPQIGDTPWTDQQFTMAFSAVGVIRAKALLDKDEGLRAWRTFGADDATAGVELLRGLYGTLQMLGPLPLMAVDWRHEKSLVAVLESLMELFQSSFISDGDLIDTQKDVLRAKSQVMATALVRSRTFDAIARLVAPSGGVRFRSNEAKRSICRSLGEMLSWLFRVVQRIQQVRRAAGGGGARPHEAWVWVTAGCLLAHSK